MLLNLPRLVHLVTSIAATGRNRPSPCRASTHLAQAIDALDGSGFAAQLVKRIETLIDEAAATKCSTSRRGRRLQERIEAYGSREAARSNEDRHKRDVGGSLPMSCGSCRLAWLPRCNGGWASEC